MEGTVEAKKKVVKSQTEETIEAIEAGSSHKKVIQFGNDTFTAHRLSIGEKHKVAVLKAQRLQGMAVDQSADVLAYMSAWCDVALDPKDNPGWKGSLRVYSDEYLIGLYNKIWEAVEKPFFRPVERPENAVQSNQPESDE